MLIFVLAAASSHLNLLGLTGMVVGGSQAKFHLHLDDLLNGELRQLLSDLEGPLLLNVSLGEDDVNLFQVTTGGLNIEEVGEGNGGEVDQGKEQVETPGATVGENGGEHNNSEVVNPVGASGGGSSYGTCAKRIDLGRVDPRQR